MGRLVRAIVRKGEQRSSSQSNGDLKSRELSITGQGLTTLALAFVLALLQALLSRWLSDDLTDARWDGVPLANGSSRCYLLLELPRSCYT